MANTLKVVKGQTLAGNKKVPPRKTGHADIKPLKPTLREEIKDYAPSLQKIANWVIENQKMYGFRALVEQVYPEGDTRQRGEKYKVIKQMVDKSFKRGLDFRYLLVRIIEDLNITQVPQVTQMLFEKAMTGDLKAAELYLKASGNLGTSSVKKDKDSAPTLENRHTPEFSDPKE